MSTITQSIAAQFSNKQDAPLFIPFITAGDPAPEVTVELAKTLEQAGADMLELGVPYSDPLADGPTIQRASMRALQHEITIPDVLEIAEKIREAGVTIPLIFFTYYNPVLQYGIERLFQAFEKYHINGIIIPDLPVEESKEVKAYSARYQVPLISLIAPTSAQRVEAIARQAEGFIYCVSSLGVTGTRTSLDENIADFLHQVKKHATVPIAVGFGISTAEQIQKLSSHCDGVIVGSAIVNEIEKRQQALISQETRTQALEEIKTFVQTLKSGVS